MDSRPGWAPLAGCVPPENPLSVSAWVGHGIPCERQILLFAVQDMGICCDYTNSGERTSALSIKDRGGQRESKGKNVKERETDLKALSTPSASVCL